MPEPTRQHAQANLFPEPPPVGPPRGPQPSQQPAPPPPPGYTPNPVWLQRMSLFILVIFCVYLGIIVTALPWLAVWDHNLFFTTHPRLWAVLRLGLTRGIISGIGLLDIWIGISEAIHYRDYRAVQKP